MPAFARFRYWRDPEATQQAWRGEACTIGDLGRLDPDGYLYLTGRRHDLIISGGVNVYPTEVENVARRRRTACARSPCSACPTRSGGNGSAPPTSPEGGRSLEEALRAAASARLAPYKRPKTYVAVAELPHTATGKLMRRAIPEHLGLDAAGAGRTG